MTTNRESIKVQWICGCIIVSLVGAATAVLELQRVENGRLFMFSLPHEAVPSDVEIADAAESAIVNKYPAIAAIFGIGLIIAAAGPISYSSNWNTASHKLLVVFAVAVLADLLTTINFFHTQGVEHEFHPAIRLFGYAYGRTIGPILGKTIQALGVVGVATLLGKRGSWLIGVVTVVYFVAAIYNLSKVI
jgi:hypothetical protein